MAQGSAYIFKFLFFIIRLHALKDESFLRTSLQRQAARLQQAAVVYAVGYNTISL